MISGAYTENSDLGQMKDISQAHIHGTVARDLEIFHNENNQVYGIVTITVNKSAGYNTTTGEEVFEPRWFKVNISNKEVVEFYKPILTKDRKVVIVGELDIIQADIDDPHAQAIIKVDNPLSIALVPKV